MDDAVADVLELAVLRVPRPHREVCVFAADSLDARLFVETQYRRAWRRVEVQAHDVAKLLVVQRVTALEEVPLAVRLQLRLAQHPRHRVVADLGAVRPRGEGVAQLAGGPVRDGLALLGRWPAREPYEANALVRKERVRGRPDLGRSESPLSPSFRY